MRDTDIDICSLFYLDHLAVYFIYDIVHLLSNTLNQIENRIYSLKASVIS